MFDIESETIRDLRGVIMLDIESDTILRYFWFWERNMYFESEPVWRYIIEDDRVICNCNAALLRRAVFHFENEL